MSNKKKPKKLRSPNVPSAGSVVASSASAQARSGGQELAGSARPMRMAPAAAAGTQANFDYTYVKKDLSRIAVLAGSFVAVLIVLSFFIK